MKGAGFQMELGQISSANAIIIDIIIALVELKYFLLVKILIIFIIIQNIPMTVIFKKCFGYWLTFYILHLIYQPH